MKKKIPFTYKVDKLFNGMNEVELAIYIKNVLKRKDKICFFCGAGISKKKPSYAPDFIELRNQLILSLLQKLESNDFLNKGEANDIYHSLKNYLQENKFWLKPEVALHWFYLSFGDNLFDALQCLDQGSPNICHNVISDICMRNSNALIITTNFDLYFEKAFRELNVDCSVFSTLTNQELSIRGFKEFVDEEIISNVIIKPHGTLALLNSIKVTLTQVSSEIDTELKNSIIKAITDSHVIVLGYSGNDYDLFPILKSFSNKTKSLTWLFLRKQDFRQDVKEFEGNIKIAFGDASKLCENIISNKRVNNQKKIAPKKIDISTWLDDISNDKIAYSLGLIGMHIGHRSIAERLCLNIQKKSDKIDYIARSYNILGILQKKVKPIRSLFYYDKAIDIIYDSRNKFPKLYGNILGNIGVIYYQNGQYSEALKYYRKSNYWASRHNNLIIYYSNLEDMGIIYRLEKEYSKAIRLLKITQKYFRKSGNLIELAHSLNNLALIYSDLNNLVKAEKLLKESIVIKEQETADFKTLAGSYMALAEIKIQNNEYYDSVKLLNKAYKFVIKNMDIIINARIYYNMAFILLKLNHTRFAKRFFQYAINLSDNISFWKKDRARIEWINKIIDEFNRKK